MFSSGYKGTAANPIITNITIYNFDRAHDQVKVGMGILDQPSIYAPGNGDQEIQWALNNAFNQLNDGVHLLSSGNVFQVVTDGSNLVIGQVTINYVDAWGTSPLPNAQIANSLSVSDWSALGVDSLNSAFKVFPYFKLAYDYASLLGATDFKPVVTIKPGLQYDIISASGLSQQYNLIGKNTVLPPSPVSDLFTLEYPNPVAGDLTRNDWSVDVTNYKTKLDDGPNLGSVTLSEDGDFIYTPDPGIVFDVFGEARDTFSYSYVQPLSGYLSLPGVVTIVMYES